MISFESLDTLYCLSVWNVFKDHRAYRRCNRVAFRKRWQRYSKFLNHQNISAIFFIQFFTFFESLLIFNELQNHYFLIFFWTKPDFTKKFNFNAMKKVFGLGYFFPFFRRFFVIDSKKQKAKSKEQRDKAASKRIFQLSERK